MRWKILFTISFVLAVSMVSLILSSSDKNFVTASSPPSCGNVIGPAWNYCGNVAVCKDGSSPPNYAFATNGRCPPSHPNAVPGDQRDEPKEICPIALSFAQDPLPCPSTCDDGGYLKDGQNAGGNNNCCSMSKVRICNDKPKTAEIEIAEVGQAGNIGVLE